MEGGEVQLENGVLKAAEGIFPLRNISHVGQRRLEFDRSRATKWQICAVAWLIFAVFAYISADDPTFSAADRVFKWAVFAVPESLFIWRLYRIYRAPPIYALTIDINGVARDVARSRDGSEVRRLVDEIARALNYPDSSSTHYHYTIQHTVKGNVENYVNGDYVHQIGNNNQGKVIHSGSGDIVTGGKGLDRSQSVQLETINALIGEIQELRRHLNGENGEVLDASVEELASNPSTGRLRILLRQISDIAKAVGEVGAPVVAAIRDLVGSF